MHGQQNVKKKPIIHISFKNSFDAFNMSAMIMFSTNMRMIINCEYTFILCDTHLRVTNYIHLHYEKSIPINKVIILFCAGVLSGIIFLSYNTRLAFFALSGLFLCLTEFGDKQTRY